MFFPTCFGQNIPVETEIRLVPPGRLIHLARYSGARRAWWVQRSHPVPWRRGKGKKGEEMRGTLWLFNIAMENGPFIDDFPIKNRDFP